MPLLLETMRIGKAVKVNNTVVSYMALKGSSATIKLHICGKVLKRHQICTEIFKYRHRFHVLEEQRKRNQVVPPTECPWFPIKTIALAS
jgi:hypothetical protein